MILPPLRATLPRFLHLMRMPRRYTLLRSLEYERLQGLILEGRILDVGGGKKNSYYHLLRMDGQVESVNIDPNIEPTHLADLNLPLSFPDNSYDHVISFNTFEHILNDQLAITETMRVLKPGGSYHFMIPFLYRVHGSPCDFHRHTAHWWDGFLESLSPKMAEIYIEPLVWSPKTSARSTLGTFRRKMKLSMLKTVLSHSRWPGQERLASKFEQVYSNMALGYYVHGRK